MLAEPADDGLITLSEVARRAELRMASLYLYFADLTELMLAVLEPVMATAETSYVRHAARALAGDELGEHCTAIRARPITGSGSAIRGILHLRNTMADRKDSADDRAPGHAAQPVIALLVEQMGGDPDARRLAGGRHGDRAIHGLRARGEHRRPTAISAMPWPRRFAPDVEHYLEAEARLFELAIRDFADPRSEG